MNAPLPAEQFAERLQALVERYSQLTGLVGEDLLTAVEGMLLEAGYRQVSGVWRPVYQ